MRLNNTLISALRALSAVPDLPSKEIERFSATVQKELPSPNASFGADPIWLFATGKKPPEQFRTLIEKLSERTGLVELGDYFAFKVTDIVVVGPITILHTVLADFSHENLTPSEMRVALQLVQGDSLRAASVVDNIGYETKRTHFKTLAGKLGLSGQTEVVRVLTAHIFSQMAHVAQPQSSSDLELYATNYWPNEVRRLSLSSPMGYSVPVIEYGPIDGTPIVVLHPMIFPPLGYEEITHAYKFGLRMIWPLRCGLLNRSAPIQRADDHLNASVEGALAVLEQLIGQPTRILALVSSGAVATRTALRRPDLVKSICFAATCYSAGRKSARFRYFGADLAELALRNEAIMTRTVTAMRSYAENEHRFRKMIETVFKGSERDLYHISNEFAGPDHGERLRAAVLRSGESIKQDFFYQTHFRWSEIADLDVPIRFVQGSDDSIHPPSDLSRLVNDLQVSDFSILDGMGHLPHGEDLMRTIESAL